jgi:heme/copper-type cytochrome/quinol oxidase subunit 4
MNAGMMKDPFSSRKNQALLSAKEKEEQTMNRRFIRWILSLAVITVIAFVLVGSSLIMAHAASSMGHQVPVVFPAKPGIVAPASVWHD